MRVTIPGANGFIGSHLTEELSKRGHLVRAVCQPGTDAGIVDGVADEIQRPDMRDGARPSSLVRGSDAVAHLAAPIADYGTFDRFQQINIEGTRNLVDASIRGRGTAADSSKAVIYTRRKFFNTRTQTGTAEFRISIQIRCRL